MSLVSGQVLGLFEIPQILVIHDYDHWMCHSGEIMMPFFQGLDDGEEFPVVNVVVLFCRGEDGRMLGTGVEIPIGILLHEHPSSSGERGISHDKEEFGGIWHLDYRGGKECFF